MPKILKLIENNDYDDIDEQLTIFEDVFPCECRRSEECSEVSNCINRSLLIECSSKDCPCGSLCKNQRFQRKEYAKVECFDAGEKGKGLRTLEDLESNSFIIEYVGKVIKKIDMENRTQNEHFYVMTLGNGLVIDATEKGNMARFMNHSCKPNCETQKWIIDGKLRIGIFTNKKILKGTELCFDYKFVRFGAAPQTCFCGELNCKGYIGEQADHTIYDNFCPKSQQDFSSILSKINNTLKKDNLDMNQMLLKQILPLRKIQDNRFFRHFLALKGLDSLNKIINHNLKYFSNDVMSNCIEILENIPFSNRNFIKESKIEIILQDHLKDIKSNNKISIQRLSDKIDRLLEKWKLLNDVFIIPKRIKSNSILGNLTERHLHKVGYDVECKDSKSTHWEKSFSSYKDDLFSESNDNDHTITKNYNTFNSISVPLSRFNTYSKANDIDESIKKVITEAKEKVINNLKGEIKSERDIKVISVLNEDSDIRKNMQQNNTIKNQVNNLQIFIFRLQK